MTTASERPLYCKQPWCRERVQRRLADLTIRSNRADWCLACYECVHEHQLAYPASPVETMELSAEFRELFWAAYDRDKPEPEPAAPVPVAPASNGFTAEERAARSGRQGTKLSTATWRGLGIFSLISIVLGIVMVAAGTAQGNDGFSGQGSTSGSPVAQHLGIALIVLPVLAWGFTLLLATISHAAREAQRYKTWKATLTPQQRIGVELAETAALYATWAGVHHHVKESRAHSAADFQARSAAYQGWAAQRQQDQMAADLHQLASQDYQQPTGPGPTHRSDIWGNLI